MSWLALASYLADALIVGSYAYMVRSYKMSTRPFHWANALGCIPLLASEIVGRAWTVLPVTAFFGIVGWYGLWQTSRTLP